MEILVAIVYTIIVLFYVIRFAAIAAVVLIGFFGIRAIARGHRAKGAVLVTISLAAGIVPLYDRYSSAKDRDASVAALAAAAPKVINGQFSDSVRSLVVGDNEKIVDLFGWLASGWMDRIYWRGDMGAEDDKPWLEYRLGYGAECRDREFRFDENFLSRRIVGACIVSAERGMPTVYGSSRIEEGDSKDRVFMRRSHGMPIWSFYTSILYESRNGSETVVDRKVRSIVRCAPLWWTIFLTGKIDGCMSSREGPSRGILSRAHYESGKGSLSAVEAYTVPSEKIPEARFAIAEAAVARLEDDGGYSIARQEMTAQLFENLHVLARTRKDTGKLADLVTRVEALGGVSESFGRSLKRLHASMDAAGTIPPGSQNAPSPFSVAP